MPFQRPVCSPKPIRTLIIPDVPERCATIGEGLIEKNFTRKIRDSTDVYLENPVDGTRRLLLSFRKQALSDHKTWWSILKENLDTPILTSDRRFRATGCKSRRPALVKSGIIGYYDRLTPQQKTLLGQILKRKIHIAGRPTAFTRHHPDRWARCIPLFRQLSSEYQKTCPIFYRKQKDFVETIEPDLRIADTVFTTVTVNQNWATHTHTDKGDFEKGMSCLAVLGEGFTGGFLGLPQRNLLVKIKAGDVIFMDAHEPHGNTPLNLEKGGARMSLVCYARTDLVRFHKKIITQDGQLYYVEKTN